jgi:alpha-N-acetylglucosaminidase
MHSSRGEGKGEGTFRVLLSFCGILYLSAFLAAVSPAAQAASSATIPVRGLIVRVLPKQVDQFTLEQIEKDPAGDVFEIESREGKIILRGNNGVSLASALNWYLKYHCHAHLSWCGDQLNLPNPLPVVTQKVRQVSPFRYRYCFNYCAFSYSLAFWDWPQWERMIDWMALHGINMPLAVTGQEAVWREVYRQLGLNNRQIGDFFVGPAFLPFGWMGCLDGWGGPLPEQWIDGRANLERKILARERELGMTPVLQGFTGHVPAALTNSFPQAKLQPLPKWCEFPPTYFVDPKDPLFVQIGKRFVEEQTRQFGTDHLYASDTFIEMQPPSNDPAFLADMGKTVYEAMRAGDPDAVWVLQGWFFVNNPTFWQPAQGRALLGSVPNDRLIALDLFCESTPAWSKTEAFYGKPWIWCIIQNFGGTVSLHGALPRMAQDLSKAMTTTSKRGKLNGIGLIFEGLDYNPIIQDFVTDMSWRSAVPDLNDWVLEFVHRRYGRRFPETEAAWQTLRETAYLQVGRHDTILCARPSATIAPGSEPYAPGLLVDACDKLLARSGELGELDTYQFDLVNLSRQALGTLGQGIYQRVIAAVRNKDAAALDKAGRALLDLCRDLDDLLATRREFLLGRWLADAERWASTPEQTQLYQFNARNLITLWGPRDSVLHEYASRQWSGMFTGFYGGRWQLFLDRQRTALLAGKTFDGDGFERDVRAWEEDWNRKADQSPPEPRGNPVDQSRRLIAKYRPLFERDSTVPAP